MAAWVRILVAAAVLIVPGAFVVVLAYLSTKAVHESYQRAVAVAATSGGHVTYRAVFDQLSFKDLVRQARVSARMG